MIPTGFQGALFIYLQGSLQGIVFLYFRLQLIAVANLVWPLQGDILKKILYRGSIRSNVVGGLLGWKTGYEHLTVEEDSNW